MIIRFIILGLIIIALVIGGYFAWNAWGSGGENAEEQMTTDINEPVQAQEVVIGTGNVAEPGKLATFTYEGRLESGEVFDSSAMHDNQPLTFVLGAQGIIPGFQIGVNGMREGGERTFTIPPSLAYGAQDVRDAAGNIVIPANSKLVFAVKLTKVADAPAEE